MGENVNVNASEMKTISSKFDEQHESLESFMTRASSLNDELTNGSYKGTASSALKAEFQEAYRDVSQYLAQAGELGTATRKVSDIYSQTDEDLASRAGKIGF